MAKPGTLPIEETSAATFHKELTDWRRQNSLWFDELSVCHNEHEIALADLAKLERTYHELAEAVTKLREELTAHEQDLHAHERVLANFLQGSDAFSLDALKQQHQTAGTQHAERQKQLDHVKQLFQQMIAKMEVVRRAIATRGPGAGTSVVAAAL
jgi:predicted  nucleic acid-binding Zn-ribbon protein